MTFNEYWDLQIDFYKKNRPDIYENSILMNLLYFAAINAWNKAKEK